MQEAQHALEQGSQKIEVVVQRLQALEQAARDAQAALNGARESVSAAERAQSEARFHERSCNDKAEAQARLAQSLAERIATLAANRQRSHGAFAARGGQVRERLQAALTVKAEREKVLADARATGRHQRRAARWRNRLTVSRA